MKIFCRCCEEKLQKYYKEGQPIMYCPKCGEPTFKFWSQSMSWVEPTLVFDGDYPEKLEKLKELNIGIKNLCEITYAIRNQWSWRYKDENRKPI